MYQCLRPLVVWYRQVVAWDGARRTLSPESGTRVQVYTTRDATGPTEEEADVKVEDTDVLLAANSRFQAPEHEEDVPEAIVAAARKGDLDVLRWFYANGPKTSWKKAMKEAAVNRHWNIVEWIRLLRLHKCPVSVLTAAIRHRQYELVTKLFDERELKHWPRRSDATELVQLLYSDQTSATLILKYVTRCRKLRYRPRAKKHPFNHENVRTALHLRPCLAGFVFTGVSKLPGSLPTEIRQLISQFILPHPEELCSNVDAAKGGWVFWLLSFSSLENSHMVLAAEHGSLAGARQMHEHLARKAQLTCSRKFMKSTMEKGELSYVKWHMHNCSAHSMEDWVHTAACMGRVDVVEWMCHEQPKLGVSQSISFLTTSHDPIAHQWLLARRSSGWMMSVMDEAARHGHISVLQRLHEYGSGQCTANAMNWAARKGYLLLVIWLHENRDEGCTTAAMDWAARKGHLDIVMWLHDNRSEGCTTSAMDWAAKNGDLTMVQWLHANRIEGCTSNAMDFAAKNGDLVMLKWLHRNRYEGCTIAAMDEAARNAHWDVVIWLHINRKEGCSVLALTAAIKNHQLDIMKLLSDRPELQSYPHEADEDTLFDLFDYNHTAGIEFMKYIGERKAMSHFAGFDIFDEDEKEEFQRGISYVVQRFNRSKTDDERSEEAPTLLQAQLEAPRFELTSAAKVSDTKGLPHENVVSCIGCVDSGHAQSDKCYLPQSMVVLMALMPFTNLRLQGQLVCSKRLVQLSMERGDLSSVKWYMSNCKEHSVKKWLYAAVSVGRVDVLEWIFAGWSTIRQLGCNIGGKKRLLRGAHVVSPSVETPFSVLKERFSFELDIREASMEYDEKIALTLGRQGATRDDLEGIPVTSTVLDVAATRGFSNIVTHLLRKGIVSCSVIGLYGAIKGGHFDVLVLLYEYDSRLTDWPRRQDEWYVLQQFLHPVDEKMLRFFRNHHDMRLRTCDLNWAVHRNDLDRVRLIRELDLVEDAASAAAIAAVSGNMKLLQVLHTGRVPVRYLTLAMDGASEEGHLSAVRYLHQRDAPCTQAAIDRAAANGHFDVVCYLRVHGKPCSPAALYCACLNGHAPVVAYLAAQGVQADVDGCIRVARTREIVDILSAFRQQLLPTQWSSSRLRFWRRLMSSLGKRPLRSQIAFCKIEEWLFRRVVHQPVVVLAVDTGELIVTWKYRIPLPRIRPANPVCVDPQGIFRSTRKCSEDKRSR